MMINMAIMGWNGNDGLRLMDGLALCDVIYMLLMRQFTKLTFALGVT